MLATGLLRDDALIDTYSGSALGMECAGTVVALGENVQEFSLGDQVIAVAPASMSSFVVARSEYVAHKPEGMDWPEGAGLPIAYLTAYYALHRLAKLQRSETVLIHAATGGVGLSALRVARAIGAKIFATAGSDEKRAYLRSAGIQHVFDSRSLEFADEITSMTRGGGVDVVLNSLSGDAMEKSLSILAPYGRFVELGKSDIYKNNTVHLLAFRNNISYFVFDLDKVMRDRPEEIGSCLRKILADLDLGKLQPLPYRSFKAAEAITAFRYMSQAKHIGKVVLSFSEDDEFTARQSVAAAPPIVPDGSYWVTGGSSGFGLAVAEWLVGCGARSLVLMSRRGVVDESGLTKIEEMRRQGARILIARGDAARWQDVRVPSFTHPPGNASTARYFPRRDGA